MTRTAIPLPEQSSDDFSTRRVSPKLVKARILGNLVWWALLLAVAIALHVLTNIFEWPWWIHLFALPVYIGVVQSILFTPRRTRALGYATRENDLLFRSGIMSRSLTVLPYGRVQDIEINEGIIERKFGLSTITLKTAGGILSDVSIPGLERAEAERIRDLVTREAHEKMAAL